MDHAPSRGDSKTPFCFRAVSSLTNIAVEISLLLLYFFGGSLVLKLFMDNPTETALHTGIR